MREKPLRDAGDGEALEGLTPRGHAELPEQALHVRANRVLGDEEALGDLVGAEMVVEQEQDLDFAGRESPGDRIGDTGPATVAHANLVEQAASDGAR